MNEIKKSLSIVLSGEAGQGLKTLEVIFAKIAKAVGYHVFTYTEFMSRIRGGNNTTEIRISSGASHAFVDHIDIVVPLQKNGLSRLSERITHATMIIGEKGWTGGNFLKNDPVVFEVPFSAITADVGGKIFLNIVVAGMLTAILGINEDTGLAIVRANLKKGGPEKLRMNEGAFKAGYAEGGKICLGGRCYSLAPGDLSVQSNTLLYGSDSIGIGALAGGCNFIAAYPMSPATSVLEFMAKHAAAFGVVVEQAEDEIAAINMAIGSWYAGGRALVSTSGGGFALMEEAVSLAGCIESPLVIHIGQRPGPATGLPTRTEQADLSLALYSGHGEFPRVIFAPATLDDGIQLTCRAFNCADAHQVPVFVLTDQYFLDSSGTVKSIDLALCKEEKYIVETGPGYRRYAMTENGISPRGVPGYGKGIVCADSDEHDVGGYITEDFETRTAMVNKRNGKLEILQQEALPPHFTGPLRYDHILVGWGTTYGALLEALERSGREDVALLHFSQVYPVHSRTAERLAGAKKTRVIVENNSTAQFGALLTRETGITFQKKILKFNGMPFSVEELEHAIRGL